MKKKIIAFLASASLAFSMLPCSAPTAYAADTTRDLRLNVLAAAGIMNGDANGNLNLSAKVTRAEFCKMTIAASVYKNVLASSGAVSPYPDVPYSHWASGYINTAKNSGLISGYLDGTFRPSGNVTLAEAATVILKLLGYTSADFTGSYPTAQMSLYHSLKLDKNITASASNELTRSDCASLIYNALTATSKGGASYAASLGYSLDSAGDVDYPALISALIDGPISAQGSAWQSQLGFTPVSVLRNDKPSSISEICDNDVIYYLKETRTVWAYSNRVTGTVESILPDKTAPSAVVVSGVQYPLETSQLCYDFSALGTFKTGDNVTLLLGRDGKSAAFALNPSAYESEVYGVITAVGTKDYSDENGKSYSGKYVEIMATDGNSYQYSISSDYLKQGDIIRVSFSSGSPKAERCTSKSLSGTVNSSATKLASYQFADDVEILDVLESSAVKIDAARLKNVTVSSSSVLFYALDQNGKISHLILKNVTGDLYEYGVLTAATEGFYKYILGGTEQSFGSMSTSFSVHTGAFGVFFENGAPSKMLNLSSVRLDSVNGVTAISGNRKMSVSAALRVYEHSNGNYFLSDIARVSDSDKYSLTGYYDKEERLGGQIRVIVAKAK